ncbi:MAG: pantoate--beta-alanine ligase [Balneolaceae bacterium]|nr:pantoate--beta-alanine ligase [Balneolaceae bacterium]
MNIYKTISEIRGAVKQLQREGKKVAFVPTMGALHNGHLSLIRRAKKHADHIVVSIYVNPEQFGPNEDFGSYPRTLERDLEFCRQEGVGTVFTPDDEIMYGSGEKFFRIEIDVLNKYLDGGSRPGYFQGIALVVNKLFNIVQPDIAVFGQKDYQQFQIIQQMVNEFNHDLELVMAPIERADDGLALSSRNAYLSEQERALAPLLFKKMQECVEEIQAGELEPESLFKAKQNELEAKGFKNDYFSTFSMNRMEPIATLIKGETYVLATAVYLGRTRLIDNIIFEC